MNKVRLALDAGFGDKRALGNDLELLFVIARLAGYRAVVERVYDRSRRDYAREDIRLLHTLPDGAGDILGKEHGGVGGLEELVNNVAARSADLDIKALELALICVKSLERGTAVVLRGVYLFECAGEVTGSIETFSSLMLSKAVILFSFQNQSMKLTVLAVVLTLNTRYVLPFVLALTPSAPSDARAA